jgi:hypothetical protein
MSSVPVNNNYIFSQQYHHSISKMWNFLSRACFHTSAILSSFLYLQLFYQTAKSICCQMCCVKNSIINTTYSDFTKECVKIWEVFLFRPEELIRKMKIKFRTINFRNRDGYRYHR